MFENTETMRWQVMEMARAERMLRDEQIAHEVDTYNELVPDEGELSATLFLELRSDAELREWLGKLVGIERCVTLCSPTAPRSPASRSTRSVLPATTSPRPCTSCASVSVPLPARIAAGAATLVVTHPEYSAETVLDDDQHAELISDLGAPGAS